MKLLINKLKMYKTQKQRKMNPSIILKKVIKSQRRDQE